ncbi:XdhC family protein [Thiomonas sp.]|uniref:XdhC family protein n=1 Tax=Thiomonas sp. TaxID=2047785 RepID=UPI002637C460|nr:XdhC family protein [Thiomonas sp.]
MTSFDWITQAERLREQGRAFALVSVLRVQAPASARPGDKALVLADGTIHGWIGGGCAQPAVLRTVRQALQDGRARSVRITPAAQGSERDLGDVLEFGMACHSGGTLELFVDPVLADPLLVVIGNTPVARSLVSLAPQLGLRVAWSGVGLEWHEADGVQCIASDDPEVLRREVGDGAFVVVATQGQRDLQGLRAALALRAGGVWFVASARKAAVLRESLIAAGADAAAVQSIVAPAGTPISARTPPEIALSVLAAVVAARRAGLPHGLGGDAAGAPVSEPGDSADRAPASCCAQRAAPVEAAVPEAGSCCSHSVPPVAAAEQPAPAAATSHSCCGH